MDFSQLLEAYRTFSPVHWVGTYRALPTYAGILCVVAGITLLLFGGGPAFRFIAGPLGGLAGFLWGYVVLTKLGITVSPTVASIGIAGALAVAGLFLPATAIFFSVGIPIGMMAGQIAGDSDWFLGFLPGFLLGGTVGVALNRYIGAVLASVLGSWVLVIGMLSALHQAGGIVTAVAQQPWGVVLAATLFAAAGTVYQIAVRPTQEEVERLRQERARKKKRIDEKKALEKRWSNYSNERK